MNVTNQQNIKASVIVAVYNTEKYLRQCLESIANQTLREIEIICVNDGSTDSSLEILEEFARDDNRFLIFTKENEGLGAASARNLGLEKARGEYVGILDSDDFFELDMLEKAVVKADSTKADIVVFGGYRYDDKNGNAYKFAGILNENEVPEKEIFSYRDCADKLYQISNGMAWNKLYRRTFLEKYNLKFQKIKYTDDAYFTYAHMALADKITVLKEYLCYYRINSGISQTDGLDNYPDSAYTPYLALKESLVEWGIYDAVKQSFVNCAAVFMRYFYDKIRRYDVFEYLHNKYRREIFDKLDISPQSEEYFYDKRVFIWSQSILENSAGEIAFKSARAYGSEATTGILRFLFPYDKIPRNSKIALLGAGYMERHYYAQIILNNYCDVVLWVDLENPSKLSYIKSFDALKDAEFDYVLVAYPQPKLINRSILLLENIGIEKEKIIIGR